MYYLILVITTFDPTSYTAIGITNVVLGPYPSEEAAKEAGELARPQTNASVEAIIIPAP